MVDLGQFKKFAINFGIGIATEVVRGWFNEQLKNVTASDLYDSVVNDIDLWSATPADIRKAGLKYKKTYGHLFKKYENEITTELLLSWLKEDHPDLYSTLINIPPEYGNAAGIIWFDRQVKKIKRQIIEEM